MPLPLSALIYLSFKMGKEFNIELTVMPELFVNLTAIYLSVLIIDTIKIILDGLNVASTKFPYKLIL